MPPPAPPGLVALNFSVVRGVGSAGGGTVGSIVPAAAFCPPAGAAAGAPAPANAPDSRRGGWRLNAEGGSGGRLAVAAAGAGAGPGAVLC